MTREDVLKEIDSLLVNLQWDSDHERIAAWMGRHSPPITWQTASAEQLQALATSLRKHYKQTREQQSKEAMANDPILDLIWEASMHMHRLGWRRNYPELLRWLQEWGVRSLGELNTEQYRLLIGRLQGVATPENPTQSVAIAHLQWQLEKLILVVCVLFNSEWDSISAEQKQRLQSTGDLLSKLRTYSSPTTVEGATSVSSQL